ncbi:MAG: hypothetical protein IBX69_18180 [Anaerolineales bacterium]|nr:hypothetical protein [Anaerolineales bacterium]
MDLLTIAEIEKFLIDYPDWCVSLFMPTHRAGRATEQDPIRFKNLLNDVEQRLQDKGMRSPTVKKMLEAAENLLNDSDFWRYQSDGLAVFLSKEDFTYYRLPLTFNELVVISHRFHVKPLLPFFTGDGHFYILALSQNQVRLLEGTRHLVDEIDLESMPKSLSEALQFDQFEKHLQYHTGSPPGAGDRAGVFHGHHPSDDDKKRIRRWFKKIDAELPNLITGTQSPIVLAGVDYLHPLFKETSAYPNLLDKGILGNPEELKPDQLHAKAWEVVQPYFQREVEKFIARYQKNSESGKTTNDIRDAVIAAHHGRVDAMMVATGVQIWGRYDEVNNDVVVHDNAEPGDYDLLDLAAAETILNSGTVYAMEIGNIPENAEITVVFRY